VPSGRHNVISHGFPDYLQTTVKSESAISSPSCCYRPRYLNIQRLNYLWTIRHSSAMITGNLVT
jgi:hypothetical protein